jgi:hypothetical protein
MPGEPFDPKQAVSYGLFVSAAYAMYEADKNNLRPAPRNMPAGYDLIAWIWMRDFILENTNPIFYGFIASSQRDPSRLIVAIRGTDNPTEIWDDLNALGMRPFLIGGYGNVALGFGRIYETLQVIPTATPAAPMQPLDAGGPSFGEQVARVSEMHAAAKLGAGATEVSVSVEVTGHSLGAALATYYVMENALKHKLTNPAICTFASPKVGDSDFTGAFNKLDLTSWRVANLRDWVPRLPFWFLFNHVETEHLIDSTGNASPSVICCHRLATYLNVLDPATQPIDQDCEISLAHVAQGETQDMAVQQVRPPGATVWPDV